tara:strand:- start:71 stop:961 length:891 start_codon:yes stop_codon:yes gene_type:complete
MYSSYVVSADIQIKVKVYDQIITNIDIEQERKYLTFLNPKLIELSNTRSSEIAKNSLITEIIKKKELEKFFKINDNKNLISIIEQNLIKRKNLKNKSELIEILNQKKLNYDTIKRKLLIEGLWNQFIYNKYIKNVKVDKERLRKNILNQSINKKDKYEYNLSEIVVSINSNETIDQILIKLNTNIKKIGFENAANIFSIANTAKNGGLIGWVNELQISEKIRNEIEKINIHEITEPIKIPNGLLLIKINDKKRFNEKINIEDQLNKLISQENSRQLNNFSIILFKKLKKNIEIYEF